MKTIAKLNADKNRIEEIINYDPTNEGQLVDLYNKNDFALLVDITGMNPQPQVGWLFANNEFQEPVNALYLIEQSMHDYIDSRYNPKWQAYLQMIYVDPECSEERKAAAKSAGDWIKSIVEGHYKSLVIKYLSQEPITSEDLDWPTLFDPTDPQINLMNLPA